VENCIHPTFEAVAALLMSDEKSFYQGAAGSRPPATFTVGDLLAVIGARRHLILRTMFVLVIAVAAGVLLVPTLYTTSAKITIDTQKNNVADAAAVLSALPTDAPSLQNQIQLLYSRDLATEVIAKLKLFNDPEFNPRLRSGLISIDPRKWFSSDESDNPDREADAVVDTFQNRLSVDALGLSTSIAITFTSRDPAKAAWIANAIADTYVDDQLQTKRTATEKTAAWLVARIRELARQAQASDSAAQAFKIANDLSEAADGTPLIDQQLAAITTQLVQARSELAQKEATNARVRALATWGDTAELGQVMSSPLIVQLRGQEADLIRAQAQLSSRYGTRHPKMIAAAQQRRDLEDKITAEVKRIASSLASDVAVSKTQVASLGASLALAEHQAQSENLLRVKLKALEANAASTRATYDLFVTRLRAIQGQEGIDMPDARVISHAPVPLVPSTPSRVVVIGAAIPAGLLLGLMIALIAERMSQAPAGIRTAPKKIPATKAPQRIGRSPAAAPRIIADVPNAGDPNAADMIVDWPHSAFALAVAGLAQRLSPQRCASRIVVVTAAEPARSSRAFAIALARAASLSGRKTILIDGELRKPAAAVAMGLEPARNGLLEVLSGKVALSRALKMDSRSSALLLPIAKPIPRSADLFATSVFADLLSHLKRSCDFVVIQAGVDDAKILALYSDAVLLAVSRTRTHQPEVLRAVEAFVRQGSNTAVVLAG
jgi:succinoglycan biosynthesis transport protein ExoP